MAIHRIEVKPSKNVGLAAWLNLIGNTLIIATGGAVRLTGSGLGCPNWPTCTPDSWIPTEELSYHSLIEFGNRLMSPVLVILAVFALAVTWKLRHDRKDLFTHAVLIGAGVLLQALVGGITVWTSLNSWIVGFHYLASITLVAVSASFVIRAGKFSANRVVALPRVGIIFTHIASLLLFVVVVLGVLTTGSGPHSGDKDIPNSGLNWDFLAHTHANFSYALVGVATLLIIFGVVAKHRAYLIWTIALFVVLASQAVVGIIQARIGIPAFLVGIHMVLAALLVAVMVAVIYATKKEPLHQQQ